MKASFLVIFLSIVISLYTSLNYYIYQRGLQAFQFEGTAKLFYKVIFLLLFLSFIGERILGRLTPNFFTQSFAWIGSFWLAAMLYFFLFILFFDILRLFNYFFHFAPQLIMLNYAKTKFYAGLFVFISVFLILLFGHINAINPKIREINITIPKKAGNLKSLRIALASDIHIGRIIRNGRIEKLVKIINENKSDIVLFAGDILDEDVGSVIYYNSGKILNNLNSKYGTYAIMGNHEYIGGGEKSAKYLESLKLTLLRDSVILIDSSFYIAGREDKEINRFSNKRRKPLNQLIESCDKALPIISLDHQPFQLQQAVQAQIDLQLSGHTHNGQIFPLNYITKAVFEKDFGYLKKGNTHFYISSGYGGWGPPVRVGTTGELVFINVKFSGNE